MSETVRLLGRNKQANKQTNKKELSKLVLILNHKMQSVVWCYLCLTHLIILFRNNKLKSRPLRKNRTLDLSELVANKTKRTPTHLAHAIDKTISGW